MNILLTNGDGYKAPGTYTLTKRLEKNHRLVIVAPRAEHSGMSHSIILKRLLEICREKLEGIQNFACSVQGTPADCIQVALTRILEDRIDLVIPGYNLGHNAGMDILYSRAISACAEADPYQLPAMAVSAQMYKKFGADFDQVADIALDISKRVKEDPVEEIITLNINALYATDQPKETVVCRIGEPMYDKYDKIDLDRSNFELKLVGRNRGQYQRGTDRHYLAQGHTTMTPIRYEFDSRGRPDKWHDPWQG